MSEWWGPILTEYYGGTEGAIATLISAEEWLERPDSVGRADAMAEVRIVDEDGKRVSKQPGRCCPVGCQVPETPQLDYTPDDTPKLKKLDSAAE